MPERYERILKWVSFALAALLLVQLTRVVTRANPLRNVVVPAPPHLEVKTSDADAQAKHAGGATVRTDATSPVTTKRKGTNVAEVVSTNSAKTSSTNTGRAATLASAETNSASAKTNSTKASTNASVSASSSRMERHGMQMPGMAAKSSDLPPVVQARVSRIVESEILAPVVHPMPAALIGIGGDRAFLRSSSGQTGMIKEGEEVGGMKLLQIGINRVLVEESGDKKELTIFAGLGGESLLPKERKDK